MLFFIFLNFPFLFLLSPKQFFITDSYWEDNVSRNITYSQCDSTGSGDVLIPLIPTPNQPPYPGFTVCTYGGVSGFICGEIVEFGATIRTEVPGTPPSESPEVFSNVTKVRMEKNYDPGNLGAPVYAPLQVPNSSQIIASPVGQVVENFDRDLEDKNIWYYIPLDRILADSKLEIAFSDLSHLLEKEGSTEFNDASLSDKLATKSNASEVNIVPRQPNQPQAVYAYGGFDVWFSSDTTRFTESTAKKCTLGFPIRKISGPPPKPVRPRIFNYW